MNKVDQLFIRACKNMESTKKLLWVYRRYYWSHGTDEEAYREISGILERITEEYFPMSAPDMIRYIDPAEPKWRMSKEKYSFGYKVMNAYRFHVWKVRGKELENLGYIIPAYFRNQK